MQSTMGRGTSANFPPQTAKITANPATTPDNRQNVNLATGSNLPYLEQLLNRLLAEGKLTQAERNKAEVIPALDDCMSPRIGASAKLVVVPVDRTNYETTTGVVAVVIKAQRFAYYLGRVVSINSTDIQVSRDNLAWPQRTESRNVIAGLAKVVYVIENTVY